MALNREAGSDITGSDAKELASILKILLKKTGHEDPFFSPALVAGDVTLANDIVLAQDLGIFYSQRPLADGPFSIGSERIRGTLVYRNALLARIKRGTGEKYHAEDFGSADKTRFFFNLEGSEVEPSLAEIVSFGTFTGAH